MNNRNADSKAQHQQPATNGVVSQPTPPETKLWHERSTWRVIVTGVIITVVGGFILAWLSKFLPFFKKAPPTNDEAF